MFQLRKIGRFFPLSEEGCIVNDCDAKYVDRCLAARINEFYIERFGERLHSVYVRGSVARGTLVPGVSDLDTFGVVDIDDVPLLVPRSADAAARLIREFPEFTDTVFVVASLSKVLSERRNPFTFLLQTQSCCIYGSSLQSRLVPYRPNIEIISEALYLRQRIKRYLETQTVDGDPHRVKMQCTGLMKGIVRSAYDLVLPAEGRYTRDLYLCYQGFVHHYPEHEADVRQAIEWAIEPIANEERIASFLSDFGTWLCRAVDELVQTHGLPTTG